MVTAFVEAACTIGETFTSLEDSLNDRVGFVLLEELIGIDVGVLIIETYYSSDMDQIWSHMVHESASINVSRERPVNCVLH